jgi:hypothetical protein
MGILDWLHFGIAIVPGGDERLDPEALPQDAQA